MASSEKNVGGAPALPTTNQSKPSGSLTRSSFPCRIKKDSFPHQPPEGGGGLPKTKENAAHLLARSDVTVSYDVIKKRLAVSREGQKLNLTDLESLANLNGVNSQWFGDFVREIGQANTINPVKAWIESKPWDGKSRLEQMCETVTCEDGFPSEMKNKLLTKWLYSAVAAALVPSGFRTRGVLTLQGDQGIGKTSWIASLAPLELRSELVKLDHHLDPHNKDSVFIGVSHWITEIGELDSSFRKDVARLKGFLTNDCDKLRLPYGRRPIELPRRTVFAASVNDPQFLIDRTGNSRWWTIPVTGLDYEHDVDMQQLFAELAVGIEDGETWWLTKEEEAELEEQNAHFRAVSFIEETLLDAMEANAGPPRYMTAKEVLEAIGCSSQNNPNCRECGAILRHHFGAPKRVQGRSKWKVPLSTTENAFTKYDPAQDEY